MRKRSVESGCLVPMARNRPLGKDNPILFHSFCSRELLHAGHQCSYRQLPLILIGNSTNVIQNRMLELRRCIAFALHRLYINFTLLLIINNSANANLPKKTRAKYLMPHFICNERYFVQEYPMENGLLRCDTHFAHMRDITLHFHTTPPQEKAAVSVAVSERNAR